MNNIKVSLIIPVYNAAEYLEYCINSVLAQKFQDFELLLINDGSTDKSGVICDEYAKKNNRIQVFHRENGGVSSARNLGLQYAVGDWICFVDSDDTVSENYLSDLIKAAESSDSDFILQGFVKPNDKSEVEVSNRIYSRNEFVNKFHLYPMASYCKFFSNKIIMNKKICFAEDLSYGEDTLFVLDYISECDSIYYLEGNNYNYNKVPDSLSTRILNFDKNYFLTKQLLQKLKKITSSDTVICNTLRYPLGKLLRSIFTNFNSNQERLEKLKTVFKDFREEYLFIFKTSGLKGKVFYTLLKNKKIRLLELIYRKSYKYA